MLEAADKETDSSKAARRSCKAPLTVHGGIMVGATVPDWERDLLETRLVEELSSLAVSAAGGPR